MSFLKFSFFKYYKQTKKAFTKQGKCTENTGNNDAHKNRAKPPQFKNTPTLTLRKAAERNGSKSHCKSETAKSSIEEEKFLLISYTASSISSCVYTAKHKEAPVKASADVLKVGYNSCLQQSVCGSPTFLSDVWLYGNHHGDNVSVITMEILRDPTRSKRSFLWNSTPRYSWSVIPIKSTKCEKHLCLRFF